MAKVCRIRANHFSPKLLGERFTVAELDDGVRPNHEVPSHQRRHQRRPSSRRRSGRQVEQDADGGRDGILRTLGVNVIKPLFLCRH